MKGPASLTPPRPAHALGRLAAMTVLAALVFLSCATENGAGVGTTPTSPPSSASPDSTASTSATSRPATGTVTLRGDGLGVVDFGQNADDVIPVLEALIGSSPTDTGSQAGWVEYIGWGDLGLFVGFDTPTAENYSGASRFVGWEYFGADGGITFTTVDGAGIGTTLSELRTLSGDRLEVSTALDECVSGTAYPFVIDGNLHGLLDRFPDDDAKVRLLRAGMGVGC